MSFGQRRSKASASGAMIQVRPHLLKARTVEEARNADEADYSRVRLGVVIEHLPGSPAPEEDVEIAEMLRVRAYAPLAWRYPSGKRSGLSSGGISLFNPAAS